MTALAYEDTGLEPEEIKRLIETNETHMRKHTEMWKDLEKYLKAEAEDRLLILPCKVGDTVYLITERINSLGEVQQFVQEKKVIKVNLENDGLWIVVDDYDSWEAYPVGSKRLLFTREEAEAALRKEANDG